MESGAALRVAADALLTLSDGCVSFATKTNTHKTPHTHTHTQAMVVEQLSASSGVSIVLGGSRVHNSSSFIAELTDLAV